MAVRYVQIDGEEVSQEWFSALRDMRASGVRFNVNEGHRTMARQAYFYALYRSGKGAKAAVPSPYAPHIRSGRFDHAIDFNNASGAMAWLHSHGIRCQLTVPGESWHVEASAEDLRRYRLDHEGPRTLRPGVTHPDVKRAQKFLKRAGLLPRERKVGTFYGPLMVKAVKTIQQKNGLKADGIVGPATWKLLERYKVK